MKTKLAKQKIAVIGAGNMGTALMKGLIEGGCPAQNFVVTNRRQERSQALADEFGVGVASSNREAVEHADVVLLAVKPQTFPKLLADLSAPSHGALFISVAAGVTCAQIERGLGGSPRVVRAMPNTPAFVKESATAIAGGEHAFEQDIRLADAIFEEIGMTAIVDEEHLDAVTGLAGSGPAYIMLIVESFADAGVKVGLSREVAQSLAIQTLRGSARLLQETKMHPGQLKDQVTSPGGTAIAGLHTLEEGGLRTTIINAVEAATLRARELGKES